MPANLFQGLIVHETRSILRDVELPLLNMLAELPELPSEEMIGRDDMEAFRYAHFDSSSLLMPAQESVLGQGPADWG